MRFAAAILWTVALLRAASPLTHIASHALPSGTHRPEILALPDGGVMVVVVQPDNTQGVGRVKHRAYRFDSGWNQTGAPFAVTAITAEFGEPADHRALLVNGELVVFYQSLIFSGAPPVSGPAENAAIEQSLMMARFTLDGKELDRRAVVAHATNFQDDNFPDFCVLWRGDRYLLSTGSMGPQLKIREVSADGTVLATHILTTSPGGVGSNIGNSLYYDGTRLYLLSASDPQTGTLRITELDDQFHPARTTFYNDASREQSFPVSNVNVGGLLLAGYISRPRGGSPDPLQNPYDAWLKILAPDLSTVDDFRVGAGGFLHVHTMAAQWGSHVLVGWSQAVPMDGGQAPQVHVEEYAVRPVIAPSGVVNAASYQPGVAPGAWITIFGTNLASTTRLLAATDIVNGALPTSLAGVRVEIDGKSAFVQYVSRSQVNAQAPADAASGPVQVMVSNPDGVSDAETATLQPLMPAFFALPQVHPGDTVAFYGTGFGATNPPLAPGTLVTTPALFAASVTVTIGGLDAPVSFAGRTAVGLDQINVRIPDLPDGDYPVVAAVGGVHSPAVLLKVRQ